MNTASIERGLMRIQQDEAIRYRLVEDYFKNGATSMHGKEEMKTADAREGKQG